MARSRGLDRFEVDVGGEMLVVTSIPIGEAKRLDVLTQAERAVALHAVAGLSNAAIAKRRKCAVRTVANQLASIYRKLGVGSRAELAVIVMGDAR